MSEWNQEIELPYAVKFVLGCIVALGGVFFVFGSYVMLVADKSKWPYPVGGVVLAVGLGIFGLWITYFSWRLFKRDEAPDTFVKNNRGE